MLEQVRVEVGGNGKLVGASLVFNGHPVRARTTDLSRSHSGTPSLACALISV